MKNLFLVTIFIFQWTAVFSQFRVFSNGNVSIGMKRGLPQSRFTLAGVGDSTYNFYLKDNKSGIFCQTTGGSGTWIYGANVSSVVNNNSKMFVGVNGNATSEGLVDYQAGRAFGVMGTAVMQHRAGTTVCSGVLSGKAMVPLSMEPQTNEKTDVNCENATQVISTAKYPYRAI